MVFMWLLLRPGLPAVPSPCERGLPARIGSLQRNLSIPEESLTRRKLYLALSETN